MANLPPVWCCHWLRHSRHGGTGGDATSARMRRDMPTVGWWRARRRGAVAVAVVLMQSQDWQTGAIFVGGLVALVGVATLLARCCSGASAGWCAAAAWRTSGQTAKSLRSRQSRSPAPLHGVADCLSWPRRDDADHRRFCAYRLVCSAWQKSLPPDAPNRFLINIQQTRSRLFSRWCQGQRQAGRGVSDGARSASSP